jgi:Protein of unknown function (DUF1761)
MLILIWLVFSVLAASLILLPLALWRREIFSRYSGARPVACPENQQAAAVNIDLRHAAETGMDGCPNLRLSDCTRWPERSQCNQACLSQALEAVPYKTSEAATRTKQIYHLPVLLAAFAAWCLGAIWHSQYLFRNQWIDAIGLTRVQVKQMVWWLSPHLVTAAACLLFAYGVAWLLAVCHRKGVLQGILMSALLCATVVATASYDVATLPHDLLAIEAGYLVLATFTVGAIVGGLFNKLVLPPR